MNELKQELVDLAKAFVVLLALGSGTVIVAGIVGWLARIMWRI